MADLQAERAALAKKHKDDQQRESLQAKLRACADIEFSKLKALEPGRVQRFFEATPEIGEVFKAAREDAGRRIIREEAKCETTARQGYSPEIASSVRILRLVPWRPRTR